MKLSDNPFFVLGASTRDNHSRILELAEEKSLTGDEQSIQSAVSTLLNPRKRLGAEIAWLPGLGPRRVAHALTLLKDDPIALRSEQGLPLLAKANLLADGLGRVIDELERDEVVRWILELASIFEQLDTASIEVMIDEERDIAEFPSVANVKQIEAELQSRRDSFRDAVRASLDKLPTVALVDTVTKVAEEATENGSAHAPVVVDDLIDVFEVEAQDFLEREKENIGELVTRIRKRAITDNAPESIPPLMTTLEHVVKNWDYVAQPIQLAAHSRGRNHDLSLEVAATIRDLAIELTNEKSLFRDSKRLTDLLREVFAEVDRVVEVTEEDASALERLSGEQREWAKEITYEASVGVLFKDTLRISPEGVEWRGRRIPLDDITHIRWGGTRHSVNGVPTGTTYKISYSTENGGELIELRNGRIYSEFTDRLWRAVGPRLLVAMLQQLRAGQKLRFGSAFVDDFGVDLERRHWFAKPERIHCTWGQLVIGNGSGTFHIAKKDERKVNVDLGYQDFDNVQVLEIAMRTFWERPSERISDLLK